MRDIKFRAWSNSRNKMVDCTVNMIVMWPNMRAVEYDSAGKQVDMELMQFTGLKDKNGVDIYEGDIVSSDYYLPDFTEQSVIKYEVYENFGRFGFDSGEQDAFRYGGLTVIGNIHQNPELLENNDE